MHDCPACRVPLHGWEEVCPSCGAKQYASKKMSFSSFKPEENKVNLVPFVIAFFCVGMFFLTTIPNSWLGKVINPEPRQEDPLEKVTYPEARQMVEQKLTEGLTAAGARGKFTWAVASDPTKPVDRNLDASLILNVETALASPDLRKTIIDPVKPYLEKARMDSLAMTDTRSHRTWTYNINLPGAPVEPDAGLGE